MEYVDKVKSLTPARATRERRKRHILDCAIICFSRTGFAGTAMAQIAAEARVPSSLIYRYFTNKDSIIAAAVEQNMVGLRIQLARWKTLPDDRLRDEVIGMLKRAIIRRCKRTQAVIGLEVMAEAARNVRIAAIIDKAEREQIQIETEILERLLPNASAFERAVRRQTIHALVDGAMVRRIADPEGSILWTSPSIERLLRQLLLDDDGHDRS